MIVRTMQQYRVNAVAVCLCMVLLLCWLTPALAIKAVKDDTKRVNKTEDTTKVSKTKVTGTTRSLLKDVEEQKTQGADSLDTWIDRDGDGVNDRLKTPPRRKLRDNSNSTETVKPKQPDAGKTIKKREKKTSQSDETKRAKRR